MKKKAIMATFMAAALVAHHFPVVETVLNRRRQPQKQKPRRQAERRRAQSKALLPKQIQRIKRIFVR